MGLGRISSKHIDAIGESDALELVAVCDIDKTRLLAPSLGDVEKYHSVDAMVANSNFDLGVVCTPSGLHAEQALKLLAGGKHVLVEKPMALRSHDAKRMVACANAADKKLFVVKQNRFNPTVKYVKQLLDQGAFGDIRMMTCNLFWHRDQNYFDMAPWRGTLELDGGVVANQASHYLDLLLYFGGNIETANIMRSRLERQIEADDTSVIALRWSSGALGSLNATVLAYKHNREGSISIFGSKGMCKIGGTALNRIERMDCDIGFVAPDVDYEVENIYGYGHLELYKAMADHLLNGNVPSDGLVTGESGLALIDLLELVLNERIESLS